MTRAFEEFQSTLPAKGETIALAVLVIRLIIFQSTLPAKGETGGNEHDKSI